MVLLGDELIGTVQRLAGNRLRFDYDEGYRVKPGATPLSLSMPIQVPAHSDRVITPWLWGLLPDNAAVLERWARQFHASASSPFSLLATPIGEDCAGAVRFVAPNGLDEALTRAGGVTWLDEDGVAERLGDLRVDATAWLGRKFTGQFSLAGAQAKTALLLRDGRWGAPTGSIPTTHVLKPAVTGFDDHDLNEHLCLSAARYAGLLAVPTRIGRFAAETAIVIERYDRIDRGDTIERIHQEDLCQALGLPPWRKYQSDGGCGPVDIVGLLRRALPSRVADDAVARFFDALVWNWLIAGTDAHAKNYSLLLAGDQVRLAPLYDISSALPSGVHERKLKMAMKIAGDYRVWLWHNNWPKAARELGLDPAWVIERVRELALVTPEAFVSAASAPEVATLNRPLARRLVDLVRDRAEQCLRLIGAPPGP